MLFELLHLFFSFPFYADLERETTKYYMSFMENVNFYFLSKIQDCCSSKFISCIAKEVIKQTEIMTEKVVKREFAILKDVLISLRSTL